MKFLYNKVANSKTIQSISFVVGVVVYGAPTFLIMRRPISNAVDQFIEPFLGHNIYTLSIYITAVHLISAIFAVGCVFLTALGFSKLYSDKSNG